MLYTLIEFLPNDVHGFSGKFWFSSVFNLWLFFVCNFGFVDSFLEEFFYCIQWLRLLPVGFEADQFLVFIALCYIFEVH